MIFQSNLTDERLGVLSSAQLSSAVPHILRNYGVRTFAIHL
jgi:hypothetical protein